MPVDIRAWAIGDIPSVLNTINTPNDIRMAANLVCDPSSPEKNHALLEGLRLKFEIGTGIGTGLSIQLWIIMITNTDNIDMFEYFYRATQSAIEQDMQMVISQISHSAACSWKFCQIHQIHQNTMLNLNSWDIFNNAIKYCMRAVTSDLAWYRLQQIWNVPLLWKFQVAPVVCACFTENRIDILYPLEDIQRFLEAHSLPNFITIHPKLLPLTSQIMKFCSMLDWKVEHQIQLLSEIYDNEITCNDELSVDLSELLQKTMTRLNPLLQRDVWNGLTELCRDYYERLDWTLIDDDVVPCYSTMGKLLFELIKYKGRIYDYHQDLIDYCKLSNPVVLRDALEHGLVSITCNELWTTTNFGNLKELINYWISHPLPDAMSHIIACMENPMIMILVKSEMLKHIDVLVSSSEVGANSPLFRALLRDPLPLDFKPSETLQKHVLLHNPSLITAAFYNNYKEDTIAAIRRSGVQIGKELSMMIMTDILSGATQFDHKLLNSIPLNVWSSADFNLPAIYALLKSGTAGVHLEILSEISFRLSAKPLVDRQFYLQYIIQHHGLHAIDVTECILLEKPFPLRITIHQENYCELFMVYEHYIENNAADLLSIERNVLLDMILKNPESTLVHQIFRQKTGTAWELTDAMLKVIPEEILVDLYLGGYLRIEPSQFLPKSLKELCSVCAVCGKRIEGKSQMLPCGHSHHYMCKTDIIDSICPLCCGKQ